MGQRELDDRGLQEGVDHRVPVEGCRVFILTFDVPHRLPAAVDARDRVPVGQRVHRRTYTVARAQPQCTRGYRGVLALEVVECALEGAVHLTERERRTASSE